MVVNVCQLGCATQSKEEIAKRTPCKFKLYRPKMNLCSVKDGYILSFMGSMVAGFITTVASLPLDIAKTRIQNMKTINGVPEYKGMLDVMAKVSSYFRYLTNLFS